MKAILVIDIEKDVDIKTLRANYEVYEDIRIKPYYQSNYHFGEGVSLKPMPERKPKDNSNEINLGFELGWNACLEDIENDPPGR